MTVHRHPDRAQRYGTRSARAVARRRRLPRRLAKITPVAHDEESAAHACGTGGRWRCTGHSPARCLAGQQQSSARRPPIRSRPSPPCAVEAHVPLTALPVEAVCPARPYRCSAGSWSIWPASRGQFRSTTIGCRRGRRRSLRARPRSRPRASTTSRRPFPAELRHLHGRWLGRLPRRRPILDALRKDRGHRRRPRGRPRRRTDLAPVGARRGSRTGPQAIVRREGGRAWDRDPSVVGPIASPHATRCRLQFRHRPRRVRGLPTDRRPRCNAGRPAALRRGRVARRRPPGDGSKATLIVLDEGEAGLSTRRSRSSPRSCLGADAGRRGCGRCVARTPQRHRSVQSLTVRDTSSTRWRSPPRGAVSRDLAGGVRNAFGPCPTPVGELPPLTPLHRRRLPLLHVPRPPPSGEIESTYVAMWMPGSEPRSPTAGICRTITASASTGAGSWPRHRPGVDVLVAIKPALDPTAYSTPASSACHYRSGRTHGREDVRMGIDAIKRRGGGVPRVRRPVRVRLAVRGRQRRHGRCFRPVDRGDVRFLLGAGWPHRSSGSICRSPTASSPPAGRTSPPRRSSSRSDHPR